MAIRTNDGTQTKRLFGYPGDRYPTTGFQKKRALYTAAGGETSINLSLLTPSLSYTPGMNQIAVKRSSGGALIAGLDFLETSTTTITFPTGDALVAGEIVEISQEAMVTGIAALAARPDCYTATATALQTVVTADFSWPYNLNSGKSVGGVMVYVQGMLWKRGAEYTEVNLGTTNTNQILVADGFIGGEDIVMLPAYQAIDQTAGASTLANQSLASLQNMMSAGTQGFIDQSTDMIAVPNTTIVGRAKIPNLANDLRASFGVERIMTQSITLLQSEFGQSGEPVFAAVNDERGLIRFVGSAWSSGSSVEGSPVLSDTLNNFIEVTFYGTGLNILITPRAATASFTKIVDGVSSGTVTFGGASEILRTRNYSQNAVISVASGLDIGVHTIRLVKVESVTSWVFGFEILNANASGLININPGTGYINGQKYVNSAVDSVAYGTGVTGGRGGRVVKYLNADGSVSQAVQLVDAAPAYLASANHVNEEVVRTYNWREFGAGRVDDFSCSTVGAALAFTLDDGTTTLVTNYFAYGPQGGKDWFSYDANGIYLTLTFVGTGLDVYRVDTAAGGSTAITASIDGAAPITLSSTGSTTERITKVASGLTYGTHTVKITTGVITGYQFRLGKFIVYGPKKPMLPATALELCDYNVMADFASPTAGEFTVGSGVLRKTVAREMVYVGTGWAIFSIEAFGWNATTTVNNDYIQYTFFGTGISYRFQNASAAAVTAQMTLTDAVNPSGTTNFSGFTVATNGAGISSFVAGTATLTTTTTNTVGNVISVSGMALGWHTIKITKISGTANFFQEAMDIITPIHAVKSNLYADLQNTLPVGSCSLTDSRKTSMIKEILPAQKAWAQAVGVTSAPTLSSNPLTTYFPLPDMSVTIKSSGGPVELFYSLVWTVGSGSPSGTSTGTCFFVDGTQIADSIRYTTYHYTATSYTCANVCKIVVPLAAGTHKIDVYWSTNVSPGTITAYGAQRLLTVQEL